MWQIYLNEDFDKPLTRVTFTDRQTDRQTGGQTDNRQTERKTQTNSHHTRFETWGVPASFQRNKMTEVYKGNVR